ncbi:MAG TPA: anti-sigma factor, partial [Acidimicrobiia bacterium]
RLATLMHHDTMSNQAEAAKLVPGAHTVMLASTGASHTAEIVMLPDGSGYLMHADLPRLASGHTYQLWAETGPQDAPRMISAGVLGRNPGVTAFRVTVPIIGFEVTDEANPGAQIPSPTPVVAGQMS